MVRHHVYALRDGLGSADRQSRGTGKLRSAKCLATRTEAGPGHSANDARNNSRNNSCNNTGEAASHIAAGFRNSGGLATNDTTSSGEFAARTSAAQETVTSVPAFMTVA